MRRRQKLPSPRGVTSDRDGTPIAGQAEHGPGSPTVLLTNSPRLAAEVPQAIERLLS